jgi:hypothetical protein
MTEQGWAELLMRQYGIDSPAVALRRWERDLAAATRVACPWMCRAVLVPAAYGAFRPAGIIGEWERAGLKLSYDVATTRGSDSK